ncbi:MAG: hypothetical protein H8E40_15185 [Chloroflexi bacterium]|nr:hypothetical protein [Chloroflexota bacterium]
MVNDSPYECPDCLDGMLFPRGECPQCGSRFRKEGRPKREDRREWEQEVKTRISSSDFQETIALARKSITIPENGMTLANMEAFLWAVHIGAWCNYCWSLETFQRHMLPIEEEKARAEHLRPALGKLAEVVAQYTMPEPPRAQAVDWLLCAKLVAARLCSFLGIDNVEDMFLYVLCPESRKPESWHLRQIRQGQDPFRRQFGYFAQALLPFGQDETSKRPLKGYIDSAARSTFELLQKKATWEECRKAYARAFPFYMPESTEAMRVRAGRAAHKIPYDDVLKFARSFFNR